MTKEIIICIIIVVLIFIGDVVTQNYTNDSIIEACEKLNILREELIKEENSENLEQSIIEIHNNWNNRHKKLAYYIEHDELEKVETDLTTLKGYIEIKEFEDAVVELDKTVYLLEHIKHKNIFNLENIF